MKLLIWKPCLILLSFFLFACAADQVANELPNYEIATAEEELPSPLPQEQAYLPPEPERAREIEDQSTYNTEEYDFFQDNPFRGTLNNPLSTFSIDVDTASYSNIRRFIRSQQIPPRDAVRVEEMINYFDYEYPDPAVGSEHPLAIHSELTRAPWSPEHWLLRVGIQGTRVDFSDMPSNNIVLLLDVSGSMNAPNKLPLLKKSFTLLSDQMRPQDRVSIVVYAGAAGLVLPPTPGDQSKVILEAMESLEAGGSTAGGAGIQLAYQTALQNFQPQGNNRVILATDGDFNVGPSSQGELIRMIEQYRDQGIFLTILGFGIGNLQDSTMEQLANKGNGNYGYIDNLLEARKLLVEQLGGTLLTIAKDVKIQVEFNPAWIKGYRLIGYENRILANEDFNNDQVDAGELGSGHTVTALYELIPADSLSPIPGVDELRYSQITAGNPNSPEALHIKLRYKEPDSQISTLIEESVLAQVEEFSLASESTRWAASVAAFGMILRGSPHKGTADFPSVLGWARDSLGSDQRGYRQGFLDLVGQAQRLYGSPIDASE